MSFGIGNFTGLLHRVGAGKNWLENEEKIQKRVVHTR